MRADRLVAALLVLQARGRVTANELAEELEISVRTARRDLEALSMAGIPVYPQRGRGGGWQLIGNARTDLTGLTASEAQALFLTVGTSAVASPALRSAAQKLVQALPESFRGEATRASEAVMIDPARWGRNDRPEPLDFLEPLQSALLAGRQVELAYRGANAAPSVRVVHPLGLVTKAGVWYLVAMTAKGQRTFRVSRVTGVEVLDEPSETPADFDLREAWAAITESVDRGQRPVTATGIADPWTLGPLRFLFGSSLTIGEPRPDGRYDVTMAAQSEQALAGLVAGLGAALELVEPATVRTLLADIGHQLTNTYAPLER
ncbi:MAG: YafY family protein [Acidimicrobiales bacterium]